MDKNNRKKKLHVNVTFRFNVKINFHVRFVTFALLTIITFNAFKYNFHISRLIVKFYIHYLANEQIVICKLIAKTQLIYLLTHNKHKWFDELILSVLKELTLIKRSVPHNASFSLTIKRANPQKSTTFFYLAYSACLKNLTLHISCYQLVRSKRTTLAQIPIQVRCLLFV